MWVFMTILSDRWQINLQETLVDVYNSKRLLQIVEAIIRNKKYIINKIAFSLELVTR